MAGRPKKEETQQKIRVSNTDIILGDSYEIVQKTDYDAPKPKHGKPTVKYPFPGNGEKRTVVYDEEMQRWDTGFEEESPCNRPMAKEGKSALIKEYVKHVKEPYEQSFRKDVSAVNDDFWDSYTYELYPGKVFNTKTPKDLFDLFNALKQGKICNEDEKDAIRNSAVYCVKNREKVSSKEDELIFNKYDAIATFSTMLEASKLESTDEIFSILEWVGFPNLRQVDKAAIKKQVIKSFDNEQTGTLNIERFLEAVEMSKQEGKKQMMEMFSILTNLRNKNKLEFKRQQFFLKDELLGNSLKDAAATALQNPDKKQLILEEWESIQ